MAVVDALLDIGAHPVIAHRGASGLAPENTLAAFELGLAQGAEAIELDVRLSADGVPVVMHDPTLDRTTGARGAVAALTMAEIAGADAGARFTADGGRTFPFRDRGVRVPAIGDVLDAVRDRPIVIELKTASVQEPLRRALLRHDAASRCVVASSVADALRVFEDPIWTRGALPSEVLRLIRVGLAGRTPSRGSYQALFPPERQWGVRLPFVSLTRAARAVGSPVHVWTVNTVEGARRLWRDGVAGVITNFPAMLREARAGLTTKE